MEVPAIVLELLKCSSCEAYLSRGPVYLQHNGATICGRCYTPKRFATRNKQYEAAAKLLRFPCKYRKFGCCETVPFVGEKEEINHEEVCEHREFVCPVLGPARCSWLGTSADIMAHCRDGHPDRVLENSCTIVHDISRTSLQNYIITAFQLLFLLQTKVCLATGKIFYSVRLLGNSAKAVDFLYNLIIKRNNKQLSDEGQVASQGCLAIQEFILSINNLHEFLGGFDNTTFTVTVKSKSLVQSAKRIELVTCAIQSCNYTDTNIKCIKHETHFCQQRTHCNICGVDISLGTLSVHYERAHQIIPGSSWRATLTRWWETTGHIVSSAAGTAVCMYGLFNTGFILRVHTQLTSEQLKEFQCIVRLTNPATGYTKICTPDVVYDLECDWFIHVKNEDFLPWSDVFDVIVEIKNIRKNNK